MASGGIKQVLSVLDEIKERLSKSGYSGEELDRMAIKETKERFSVFPERKESIE